MADVAHQLTAHLSVDFFLPRLKFIRKLPLGHTAFPTWLSMAIRSKTIGFYLVGFLNGPMPKSVVGNIERGYGEVWVTVTG